ncbi:MAG: sulfate adenylyltransferase [Phototrophicaceae bacterium]
MAKELIAPHGGVLIDRVVPANEKTAMLARAENAPKVGLSAVSLSDVMLIAMGVVSPLKGFMGQADYRRVVNDMHLESGEPWTIPIALPVDIATAQSLEIGQDVALVDADGNLVGLLELSDKYSYDKKVEAENVYRTTEEAHPGVARVYAQDDMYLGGDIWVFDLPEPEFPNEFLTPAQSRAYFEEQGWSEIVAFQTRNPIHRAHEYLQKVAMEVVDGLMLHPLVGETKSDDVPAEIRMESYRVVIDHYYPKGRVLLNTFPAAMRYAGPREAVFHAICRKNYGCSHFIVGRDHAGVGKYYGTYDAQDIFDEFDKTAIDITPLKFEHAFYSKKENKIVTAKTSIYGKEDWMFLSGTQVRELLTAGKDLPEEFTRPEVSKVLLKGYAQMKNEA